jgi:hypothetical protein
LGLNYTNELWLSKYQVTIHKPYSNHVVKPQIRRIGNFFVASYVIASQRKMADVMGFSVE